MDEIIMPEVNIPEEDLQRMKEALDVVAEQIKVVVDAVVQVVKQITDNLCKTFSGWWDSILKCFENKRVVHLAFHAKKKRTRKKNRNRLLKEFLRIMTLEGAKNDT